MIHFIANEPPAAYELERLGGIRPVVVATAEAGPESTVIFTFTAPDSEDVFEVIRAGGTSSVGEPVGKPPPAVVRHGWIWRVWHALFGWI